MGDYIVVKIRDWIGWIVLILLILLAFIVFFVGCGVGSGGVGREPVPKTTTNH
jgi:hypothetical protein